MVIYESLYPGSTYLLDPNYNFTGYRIKTGEIGGTTSIQTANQLSEVNKLLNQGIKTAELSIINADVLEMIPKDHFKEIQRLNQLTGAESTIHAPIVEPSGLGENGWSEENQKLAERQFNETIERANVLNKNGNMPVTIHSSTIQAGSLIIPDPDNKGKDIYQRITAIDQDTGQLIGLKREIRYTPRGKEGGELKIPEQELENANDSYWRDQLYQVAVSKEGGDRILREFYPLVSGAIDFNNPKSEDIEKLSPAQKSALQQIKTANIYLENSYQTISNIYNKAYKYSEENPETQKKLQEASEKFKTELTKRGGFNEPAGLSQSINGLLQNMEEIIVHGEKQGLKTPKKYVQVEEFATKKTSDTLSNVALNAYKKFGANAPTVSIENPPYGTALSTGKELKKLVEESKEKFVNKLEEEGKNRKEAQRIADRLIGVTWDTSHINMIRRQGFDRNRVVEEIKQVAPLVKHVHFNDNFGTTHTDLPPGMGDVPISAVMQELEDAKFKGKKIFEGGNFVQHFQSTPVPYILEHSGSPLYTGGGSGGPFWNQLGGLGNYYIGHGPINPAVHHSLYQSGFSTLPVELGGEVPGQQSRFAGTPNA